MTMKRSKRCLELAEMENTSDSYRHKEILNTQREDEFLPSSHYIQDIISEAMVNDIWLKLVQDGSSQGDGNFLKTFASMKVHKSSSSRTLFNEAENISPTSPRSLSPSKRSRLGSASRLSRQ